MWRGAWQRLATRHTSRSDVAVTNGHCSRTVLPLTPPETQNCSVRTCSSLSRTFCPPNRPSPDLNTVNLPSIRCALLQQTVYHHQSFSLVDKMKRAIVKSMAETTAWRSHCQSLLSSFYLWLMFFARWRHYFPRLIQMNYGMMTFRMKRPWFVPNLVKICSIFLKL